MFCPLAALVLAEVGPPVRHRLSLSPQILQCIWQVLVGAQVALVDSQCLAKGITCRLLLSAFSQQHPQIVPAIAILRVDLHNLSVPLDRLVLLAE